MSIKSDSKDLLWIATCVIGILVAFFSALFFRGGGDPASQIALKEQRIALLSSMRLSLAAASEAQNSAVLSTSEQDSQKFAEEARKATADLEQARIELEKLLKERSGPHEAELMQRVAQAFREFQQIDAQLLELALQGSNRKAFSLAFGPAMKLLNEMDKPLSQILADQTNLTASDALLVVKLASEIRIGILRIQVLLSPHILEASDQKMDEFELELTSIDQRVRADFEALIKLLPDADRTKVEPLVSRYEEFENLKSQIITLSRQNTNVRAAEIVLKEKRKAMLACQDALVKLEQAIQAEPINSSIPAGRSPQ